MVNRYGRGLARELTQSHLYHFGTAIVMQRDARNGRDRNHYFQLVIN
jgi:hypothetical protein